MATTNGIIATLQNAPERLEAFTHDYRCINPNDIGVNVRNGYAHLMHTAWSDYGGNIYNRHAFNVMELEGYSWSDIVGGKVTVIPLDEVLPTDADIELLLAVLLGDMEYIHDSGMYETEEEVIQESWDGYLAHDLRQDIEAYITGDTLTDLDILPDDATLLDMVYDSMDATGNYWVHESATSAYIPDYDDVVADIGDMIMAEYMKPNVMPGQGTLTLGI